jgi:simple sugar transport system substrate-binding protein
MRSRTFLALAMGASLLAAACNASPSASGGGGGDAKGVLVPKSDINIEVVTHGQAIDGFWGVVRNGVAQGAKDMGVTVNYSAPDTESDMVKMSQLIEAAIAKNPDGIVVSIPNPDALGPAIERTPASPSSR